MLACHSIAAIDSSKDVAGQFSRGSRICILLLWLRLGSRLGLLLFRLSFLRFRGRRVLFLFIWSKHLVDGVEGARAVVAHKHWSASQVTFGQNLRAATTTALSIKKANLIVAQIAATSLLARGKDIL